MNLTGVNKMQNQEQKNQPYAKNNRSLLNASFILEEDKGLIIVLGHGNSRTIYLESIKKDGSRALDSYSISFSGHASDATGKWDRKFLENSKATVDMVKELRGESHTHKEYQVAKEDLEKFHNAMYNASLEEHVIYGEEDADINKALSEINLDRITFGKAQEKSFCNVS